MNLEWIGHACFRMTAQDGTVVVTDPYDESVGIALLPLCADLVTMSHGHHDHIHTAMLQGKPMVVRGLETAQCGAVRTWAAASYHDDVQGAARGDNALRVFAVDGLKIVHMGDQGCMPDAQALATIADADVMLIPTGGTYTLDARGAQAVVAAARPRCVIPMHVKTPHCLYPIQSEAPFLTLMGATDAQPVASLTLMPGHVPQGVVRMEALAERAMVE